MPPLDSFLKVVADEPNWARVVHRCAWCGRVNERGQWVQRPLAASQVTTDGMCPACGRRALAQLASRRPRPTSRAA
jgi:DNA-directed RNA polymerase subunit RPC12/RpoP